ncbi:minor histocompatibility antigen H13 isoform X6 [Mirounga angustirostris]|uniref:minor histocompatibility antigen H13 isoform X6 n=1 Tax=Mirounga angustirostris TaxID=9716 RepID=UPI001E68741C|nr:minor histocompatibility antigen H13 isoform X4 [Mirounga angustirostris]
MDSALSDPHNGSAEAGGAANGTTRPPSTPEGIALAYGSLLLMALLPIFFGALRSVRCARGKNASDMPETITSRDAARFPIIASCTLLGLYLFFKIFSQEYINLLLSVYFFVLGILALSHTISPFMNKFFPANFPNRQYQLLFTQGSGENKEEIINYEFDAKDLVCLGLSSIVGVWYLLRKHWIANNLFGLAFSLNGVELLHLNNVSTGCILLGGLFIYDVFWVFGTNVMVTVAKSFEAPIKLVFPQDLLEKGLEADNFAMLGLGDIVIPGIFIALLLRFDISLKKNTHTYFYTSFAAYIFGLGLTIFIMHIFKHAQPALLYLVPACIGFPVLVALAKGEVTEMFSTCARACSAQTEALRTFCIWICHTVRGFCSSTCSLEHPCPFVQLRVLGGNPASHPEAHPLPHSLGLPSQPGRLHATEASWPSPPAPAESQRHVMPGGCPPARFPPTAPGPKL